jgi:CO/xanthine dehydrogenase FAD-binding subunit
MKGPSALLTIAAAHHDGEMARISLYRRPETMDEAFTCLDRPGAVVIGGGLRVNPGPSAEPIEVVDLQALGLSGIEPQDAGRLRIGSMTNLQQLADSGVVPASLRDAARREQPSTLRSQATLGGCVVSADPESELLAVLLVHGAVVHTTRRAQEALCPVEKFLSSLPLPAGTIVTAVTIETGGDVVARRTGRTRADGAIVSAVGRRTRSGGLQLAMSGVGATPLLLNISDGTVGQALVDLTPPDDFRGSREYRRALATVLATRVLEGIA